MQRPKVSEEVLKDVEYEESLVPYLVAMNRLLLITTPPYHGVTITVEATKEETKMRMCGVCKTDVRAGTEEPGLRWRHRSCHRKALADADDLRKMVGVASDRTNFKEDEALRRFRRLAECSGVIPEIERGVDKPKERWWTKLWKRVRGDRGW